MDQIESFYTQVSAPVRYLSVLTISLQRHDANCLLFHLGVCRPMVHLRCLIPHPSIRRIRLHISEVDVQHTLHIACHIPHTPHTRIHHQRGSVRIVRISPRAMDVCVPRPSRSVYNLPRNKHHSTLR